MENPLKILAESKIDTEITQEIFNLIAFTEAALIYEQFLYNIAKGFSIKIEIPDYLDIYFKQF